MALVDILYALSDHEVEYIVVGGIAAILRGVPMHSNDVDVVYARDETNIARVMSVLAEIDAVVRNDSRRLRIDASQLRSEGHKLRVSKLGVVDLLGALDPGTGYEELFADSTLIDVNGRAVRVVTLERLIAIKRALGRPKDRAMLMQLEATLDEIQATAAARSTGR